MPFVPLVSLQKWIVRRSMPHATWAALLACCTLLLVVPLAVCWPVRTTLARSFKVCGRWSTQRSQEILILAESAESLPWIFVCLETWLSFFIERCAAKDSILQCHWLHCMGEYLWNLAAWLFGTVMDCVRPKSWQFTITEVIEATNSMATQGME